jgi:AraC-like DNA-binding protein
MGDIHSTGTTIHLYVWHDRFLYVGPSQATSSHRNHAATWLAAPGTTLRVALADGTLLQDEVVFIPSGAEYSTEAASTDIAALFWEPESASFRAVLGEAAEVPSAFPCRHGGGDLMAALTNPSLTLADAGRLIDSLFGLAVAAPMFTPKLDARVEAALSFLRESPERYGSIEALAEKVHLSSSRLAHIFKSEVGVPVRRYVLWAKMRRALDLAIAGDSLTSAALSAGFADSAHLSRTVRSMTGIAPESLFRHRNRLIVHKDD